MQLEQPLLPQIGFRRKLAAAMVVTLTLMLGVRALTSLAMLGAAFLRIHGMGREVFLSPWIHFFAGQLIFLAALCAYLVSLKRRVNAGTGPTWVSRWRRGFFPAALFVLWMLLMILPRADVQQLLAVDPAEGSGELSFSNPPMGLVYAFAIVVYAAEILSWSWWCDAAFGHWREFFRVVLGWSALNLMLFLSPFQILLIVRDVAQEAGNSIYGTLASGAFGGGEHEWVLIISRGIIFYPSRLFIDGGPLRYVAGVMLAMVALDLWRRLRRLPSAN